MDTWIIEVTTTWNWWKLATKPWIIFVSWCTNNSDYSRWCIIYKNWTCCEISWSTVASNIASFNTWDCIYANWNWNTRIIYFW